MRTIFIEVPYGTADYERCRSSMLSKNMSKYLVNSINGIHILDEATGYSVDNITREIKSLPLNKPRSVYPSDDEYLQSFVKGTIDLKYQILTNGYEFFGSAKCKNIILNSINIKKKDLPEFIKSFTTTIYSDRSEGVDMLKIRLDLDYDRSNKLDLIKTWISNRAETGITITKSKFINLK